LTDDGLVEVKVERLRLAAGRAFGKGTHRVSPDVARELELQGAFVAPEQYDRVLKEKDDANKALSATLAGATCHFVGRLEGVGQVVIAARADCPHTDPEARYEMTADAFRHCFHDLQCTREAAEYIRDHLNVDEPVEVADFGGLGCTLMLTRAASALRVLDLMPAAVPDPAALKDAAIRADDREELREAVTASAADVVREPAAAHATEAAGENRRRRRRRKGKTFREEKDRKGYEPAAGLALSYDGDGGGTPKTEMEQDGPRGGDDISSK
jgi:hypothetical protein